MASGKLIRVRPYHAAGPEAPSVWHDRSDCEQGRWIPSVWLRAGTHRLERCPECARLDGVEPVHRDGDDEAGRETPTGARPSRAANVPRVARVQQKEPRRLRATTVLGVAASGLLVVLGGLWFSGRLDPGDEPGKARTAVSTSTTRKPAAFASGAASPPAPAITPTAPSVAPAPAQPAPEAEAAARATGGSFYLGPDGYTHGTEADGEVCSSNPDDPLFPCSQQVPGSGGFGSPLPEDADDSGPAAPGGLAPDAAPGAAQDPAARAAAREQRQAARRELRANRRP